MTPEQGGRDSASAAPVPARARRRRIAGAVVISLLLIAPRAVELDRFAVQDEYLWAGRAVLYARHVAEQNWEILHTYPPFFLHPGATLLGITAPVAAAYRAVHELPPEFADWPVHEQRGLAHLLRLWLGLVQSGLLALLAVALRRLPVFRDHPLLPWAAVIFLGLEPWLWGVTRMVHLDSLLSLFSLLAVAMAVRARAQRSPLPTAGAGALWGLAFMTKTPALVFLPVALLPLLLRPLRELRTTVRQLAFWIGGALIVVLASWPPMWFHPLLRLRDIFRDTFRHVDVPEIYAWPGSHPPLFVTLLSTVSLVGLALYLLARLRDVMRRRAFAAWLAPDLLLLGGLLFGAMLAWNGTDHPRKDLPAIAFLAVPAALGVFRSLATLRVPRALASGALLALQLAVALPWFPHLPSYHNPLLNSDGKRLLADMGNGLRPVADFLNGIEEPSIVGTNTPGLLLPYVAPLLHDRVRRLPKTGDLAALDPAVEQLLIPASYPARVRFDPTARALAPFLAGVQPAQTFAIRDVPLLFLYDVPPALRGATSR